MPNYTESEVLKMIEEGIEFKDIIDDVFKLEPITKDSYIAMFNDGTESKRAITLNAITCNINEGYITPINNTKQCQTTQKPKYSR